MINFRITIALSLTALILISNDKKRNDNNKCLVEKMYAKFDLVWFDDGGGSKRKQISYKFIIHSRIIVCIGPR